MSAKYNFNQSQKLLNVNPKTFKRWLEDAGIDPDEHIDPADPRQKLLTEEQLRILAEKHGRALQLPPEEAPEELPAPVTLSALDERLSALEQQITRRLDAIEAQNQHILQVLADLQQHLVVPVQSVSPPAAPISPPHAQSVQSVAHTPSASKAAPKKSTRKTAAKGKRLPATLAPLRAFAQLHKVPEKAVEYAVEQEKIPVSRGKWLYNHQHITLALDRAGQHDFYERFHDRPGFQRCEHCPHIASA